MNKLIGYTLIVAGIFGGIYVGAWLMLIGGIVEIIEAVKSTPVNGIDIGIGLLRVVLSGIAGWVTAFFTFFVASVFLGANINVRRKNRFLR
jgi:hypothetical protein